MRIKYLAQRHNKARTHGQHHSNHQATIHPPLTNKKINKYWLKKVNYMYNFHSRLSRGNTDCKLSNLPF